MFYIGLLIIFEAAVGLLTISGGRRTQVGLIAVIAFYSLLWLFGAIETIFVLVMLVPMWLLLRAERRAETRATGSVGVPTRRPAHSV